MLDSRHGDAPPLKANRHKSYVNAALMSGAWRATIVKILR
jgi:hypothetical protein